MLIIRISLDKNRCTLCYLCVKLCPAGVFKISNRVIVVNEELCIACYGCIVFCPTKAISIDISGYRILDFEIHYRSHTIRSADHHHYNISDGV